MSFTSKVLELAIVFAVTQLATAHTSYNSTTQICCNGTVIDRLGSKNLSCCGSTAYDYTRSRCCGQKQVLEFPKGHSDRNYMYGCCYNETTVTTSIYHRDKQLCCNGNVLDKPDPKVDYDCCKDQMYKRNGHNGELGCCQGQVFHRTSHICCVKYSYEKNVIRLLDFRVRLKTSNTSACCGLQQYDYRSDVCCGDTTVKPKTEDMDVNHMGSCCNGTPYDSAKKLCCRNRSNNDSKVDETLHNINRVGSTWCCGALSFDFRYNICCDDKIVKKPEGTDERMMHCCGDRPIINIPTQVCDNNTLYERKDYNYHVCGDRLFDTREQLCCGGQVLNKKFTMACCNDKVFDITTNKCCSKTVEPLTKEDLEAKHDACCAVQV